jgi:hypothetical protein
MRMIIIYFSRLYKLDAQWLSLGKLEKLYKVSKVSK